MQQLKLFIVEKPNWLEITLEWLLKWLQNEYPEMKFKIVDDEIKQNFTKYANCTLSIDKDADLKIWKNPVIVHLSTEQKYGHWCGMGEAVNSFEELEEQLALYIECCKNHAKGYAVYRKERRLQDE